MPDYLLIFGAKYLFVFSLLYALFLFVKSSPETRKQILITGLISLPLILIVSLIARELYFNPRPFVVGGFEPLIPHEPDNGFPSDHTLLTAALASVFIFFHRRASVVLWILAALVGLSRVFAGVHHLTDILGSVAIAILVSSVVYKILKLRKVV